MGSPLRERPLFGASFAYMGVFGLIDSLVQWNPPDALQPRSRRRLPFVTQFFGLLILRYLRRKAWFCMGKITTHTTLRNFVLDNSPQFSVSGKMVVVKSPVQLGLIVTAQLLLLVPAGCDRITIPAIREQPHVAPFSREVRASVRLQNTHGHVLYADSPPQYPAAVAVAVAHSAACMNSSIPYGREPPKSYTQDVSNCLRTKQANKKINTTYRKNRQAHASLLH